MTKNASNKFQLLLNDTHLTKKQIFSKEYHNRHMNEH